MKQYGCDVSKYIIQLYFHNIFYNFLTVYIV